MTMRHLMNEIDFKYSFEDILNECIAKIDLYPNPNDYDKVIKARLLSDIKIHITNLKNARINKDNPRYQKG